MATRITGSTKRIEVLLALGQRSAERLAGNADLADRVRKSIPVAYEKIAPICSRMIAARHPQHQPRHRARPGHGVHLPGKVE